jgi:hypothetical protein
MRELSCASLELLPLPLLLQPQLLQLLPRVQHGQPFDGLLWFDLLCYDIDKEFG